MATAFYDDFGKNEPRIGESHVKTAQIHLNRRQIGENCSNFDEKARKRQRLVRNLSAIAC